MPRRPVGSASADLEQEVVEDLSATRRVSHLGMELNAKERPASVLEGSNRGIDAGGGDTVARRRSIDVVAVTHPDGGFLSVSKSLKQAAPFNRDVGSAVLAAVCPRHLAPGQVGEQLHAVTESQDRWTQLQQFGVGRGNAVAIHRVGTAGENDSLGVPASD